MHFLLNLVSNLKTRFLAFILVVNVFLDTLLVLSVSSLLAQDVKDEFTRVLGPFSDLIDNGAYFEICILFLVFVRFITTRYALITLDIKCVELENAIRDKVVRSFLASNKKITNEKQTEFLSDVLMWSQLLSVNLFVPLVRIISDTIFLICVIFYSALLSPEIGKGLAMLAALIGIPFFLTRIFKRNQNKSELMLLQNSITASLLDVINNKASIKLFPKSLERIIDLEAIKKYTIKRARLLTVARLPKLYVETLLFGLVVIGAILSKLGTTFENEFSFSDFIPICIAMFRIAPSVTGYLSFISIYGELKDVLEKLNRDIKLDDFMQNSHYEEVKKVNKISILGGKKSFHDNHEPIFNDLYFDFEIGKLNLITGASGAGKSTLVNCILGIEKIDSGQILYDGEALINSNFNSASICPQDHTIINGNLKDNATLFTSEYDANLLTILIDDLNLSEIQGHSNLGKISLSGGQRQRIGILRALIAQKPLIVFDEPTSALDATNTKIVVEKVTQLARHHLVIVITHNTSLFTGDTNCLSM